MKITFVSTGSVIDNFPPNYGGIELLEFDLMQELQKRGHEIQIFASKSTLPNSVNLGIDWIQNERLHNFLSMLNAYNKRHLLEAEIIHAHYPLTALPFLKKKPMVYTEHNWYNLPGMDLHKTAFTPIFNFAQKKVYESANAIIALSSEIKKVIDSKTEKQKTVFIPNFVNSSVFKPSKKNQNEILLVGRLSKEKGIDLLLKALEKEKNYSLKIAGSGPEEKALKRLARELKINAEFLGFVPHEKLPAHFASASIFVLPSYFEVMPVVILEAMSSGCAIIASNAFGISDQIDAGKNGFVIEKGSVNQLKQKLGMLLSDKKLVQRFGVNARKKVLSNFDVKVVAGKTEKLYETVLSERK